MSVATKIIPDKKNNIVTLENYDIQPVLLTNIKREQDQQVGHSRLTSFGSLSSRIPRKHA